MNKALAVFNINAGRKKALKYKKKLLHFLRKNYDGYKIINIDELTSNEINNFNTIIAIGGDGTINKVLPYLTNTNKKLGIIPCGTANLLAAKLNIPENFDKALNVIKSGTTKKIDTLKINEEQACLRFGLGYDSDVICKTPQSMKNKFGYFAYFIAGILLAFRLKNKAYRIKIDNNIMSTSTSCIIIANAANMYKKIISTAPKSSLEDGLLDIFILNTQNPIIFFVEVLKMFFNIKINNNNAKYIKGKSIEIENNWTYCHIDGEKTKLNTNILINVINQSLIVHTKN